MMIHDAWGICVGAASDMRSTGELLDKISDNIASIYAARSGADVSQWRSAMLAETWYTAQEAVDAGLADEVRGTAPTANASFDLSAFRYAGRDEHPVRLTRADFSTGPSRSTASPLHATV